MICHWLLSETSSDHSPDCAWFFSHKKTSHFSAQMLLSEGNNITDVPISNSAYRPSRVSTISWSHFTFFIVFMIMWKKYLCVYWFFMSFLHIFLKTGVLPVFVTNLSPTVIVDGKYQCLNKAYRSHQAISHCSHPSSAPWWDSWQRKEDTGPR